jgi:hypothetical protein
VTNSTLTIALTAGLLILGTPPHAHHSRAEFSGSDDVQELSGELVESVWRNPHPRFTLRTVNEAGEDELWMLEAYGNALTLQRTGVMGSHFEVGQQISVVGRISTQRDNVLLASHILLADGTEAILEYDARPYWSANSVGGGESWTIDEAVLASAGSENRGIFRVWSIPRRGVENEYLPFTETAVEARASFDPLSSFLTQCVQPGMPMTMMRPHRYAFVDKGSVIELHGQYFDTVRTIVMDDAANPESQPASHLGFSVGRWEDGVLVVETTRIDWPFLDPIGTPQSEAMHVVERFSLSSDQSRLDYLMTMTDASTFTAPATYAIHWLALGEQILPYDCLLD